MRVQLWQAGMAVAVAGATANAQSVTITQSVDPVSIVGLNSIACAAANPQRTTENSYYRTFDLTQFPAVTGPFHITRVDVAVENATHPNFEQDLTINLWVDCNGGAPFLADLTLIGSFVFVQIDTGPFIEEIPVDVTICADATLVVEVNSVDHRGETVNAVYFIGSNPNGQNSPSYIRADACGLTEIQDIATVGMGFPNMHIVLSVLGDIVAACDDPCVTACPCACDFDPDPLCDIFDFLAFQNQFVLGDPCACLKDPDPLCDIFDFLAFQNEFVLGCP
ncbi:MAG: hypothetical protein IID31_03960 [Planctomycetes bacterium]|nr:hypothetical protein [Planctomycetota bacterium]